MTLDASTDSANKMEMTRPGLIDELKAVRDSVEELYLLLDHIWRNRQELHDILEAATEDRLESARGGERLPETIACALCGGPHKAHSVAQSVMWRQTRFAGDF